MLCVFFSNCFLDQELISYCYSACCCCCCCCCWGNHL